MTKLANRRNRLFEEQGGKCYYCRRKMSLSGRGCRRVTIEHLVRRSDGGNHSNDNVVAACARCNEWRDDIPPEIYKRVCRDIERVKIARKQALASIKLKTIFNKLNIPHKKIPNPIRVQIFRWYDKYILRHVIIRVRKKWTDKENAILAPYQIQR